MATASGVLTCFFRSVLMISRRRTDFPVPIAKKDALTHATVNNKR